MNKQEVDMLTFIDLCRTQDQAYSELPPMEQKKIRKDTTKELCSLFNITPQAVFKWRKYGIPADKQLLLCKMYKLDPQVLL